MKTKAQQYQEILRLYRQETGLDGADMHEVGRYAMKRGVVPPVPKTPEALLAEKFSAAAREETAIDSQSGRPYRMNFAVTDNQMTLWHTLDHAPRRIAHKGLMQRREQMVGDAVSLSDDVEHWNRINPAETPIQIPLDFEFDVMLRRNAPPDEEIAA